MDDERPREDKGTYEAEVTDDELLTVFVDSDNPVLTARMVAEHVSIGRKAVYARLQTLHDDGKLERMEVGARAVVWWPVETE